ncbi:MAG: class I SAM-dependent methyltransferase [Chlorobiaceae bacterium]|nr:class I SAM-dependent methyltransferase [Chlorobiaceae bacterium]
MTGSWNSTQKFNNEALQWDENPQRRLIAEVVGTAIVETEKSAGWKNALEIGCGTGLVSLLIAPHTEKLTAIDTSREMVEVLRHKISESGISNIRIFCSDLEAFTAGAEQEDRFDLIYCSMSLHHIQDTGAVIASFSNLLAPGGTLAIADLEPEDGSFHDDPAENVHHGFERSMLSGLFSRNGLRETSFRTIHIIRKPGRNNEIAEYPVFLATASTII